MKSYLPKGTYLMHHEFHLRKFFTIGDDTQIVSALIVLASRKIPE